MTPAQILALVSEVTGVPVDDILSPARQRHILYPRFLAIAAIRVIYPWWTLKHLGTHFQRDFGTIRYARTRHADLLQTEPGYRSDWTRILARLETLATVAP